MSSTRFNPPVPNLEELSADGTTRPDSDGIVEFDGNDFAGSTNKRTLRSYISSLTRGEVPLVVEATAQGIIEYNGPIPDHGNAYPLGDESNPQYTFTETGIEGGGVNVMQNYSDSGQFSVNDKTLKNIVNKGELGEVDSLSHANGRDALSGHLLLQGVIGSADVNSPAGSRTDGAQVLIDAVPEILDDNNRYSPGKRTFDVNEDDDVAVEVSNLSDRIKISRDTELLSRSSDPNAGVITVEALSKVAVDIMLKATGKPNGPDAYPVAGVIPAMVQEGFKRVDSEDLRARTYSGIAGLNTTVEGTGIEFPNTDGVGETRYTDKSFGVTYNPLENFTGIGSSVTSYIALAGAATGVVLVVGSVIAAAAGKPEVRPTYPGLSSKPYAYLEQGKFKFKPQSSNAFLNAISGIASTAGISTDVSQLLGIYTPTNEVADYGQCVILGFASLIGTSYNNDDIITESLFGTERTVLSLVEFFKIIGMIGIRAAAIAVTGEKGYYMNLFREIVKDSGSLIRDLSDNPLSLLTPGEGIAGIANAKIVRFINVLAQIGDMIVLQAQAKRTYKFNSDVSNPYDNTDPLTGNNDFYTPDDRGEIQTRQSFAISRIKSPRIGSRRGSALGVSDLPSAHLVPDAYAAYVPLRHAPKLNSFPKDKESAQLRLAQGDVARLERILDAEYMPFYFHDLRTNEIVAFHAFLEDLSDNYTANYNNAGGYGRIEEIKTYKDTKRSVSVTFNIIAMNPDDFDYMWWQINKLTTMVYPQWSKGRQLQAEIDYAKFKYTQPFSQIPTSTPVVRVRVGDLIRSNYSRFNLKRLFGFKDESNEQEKAAQTKALGSREVSGYSVPPGTYILVKDERTLTTAEPFNIGPNLTLLSTINPEFEGLPDVLVATPAGDLISVDPAVLTESVFYVDELQDAEKVNLSTEFYNVDSNSVIRSFETTAGMGLASVVTQLQFSWMEQGTLWGAGEDGPGYRAPRSCKVQMSFDPIHDIAPGIDYEGLNRAPIYPVGNIVNNMVEGLESEPYGVGSEKYTSGFLRKKYGA